MSMYRDNLARPLPKKQETTRYAPAQKVNRTAEQKAIAREKVAWLGTILLCVAISVVLVSRYAGMVSLNYAIQDQQNKLQALQDSNLKLEQQELTLESPDRIRDYAQNVLHMKPVTDSQLVILPGSHQ